MPTIVCDTCLKSFYKRQSAVKNKNYCSRKCFSTSVIIPCGNCGKEVKRPPSQILGKVFCSRKCAKPYLSKKFTDLNIELNPDRMIPETKEKLRISKLGKGEGKTYEKTYGVHTHRIEAEKMIGRKLLPGEVVHHIDEDKRNNIHSNLMVFSSQAEHAKHHAQLKNNKNADR